MIYNILIRFFDIIFSFFAMVILFPFMIPIMIILKLSGEHYIFYCQPRVGRHGENFNLFKFATMLKNSPNLPGGLFTYELDPRILPMGRFLRKTKINELPQLLNIFIGQMSFVGYRPLVREGYNEYPEKIKQNLFNMRPGLSGIGSIALRNEEEILQSIENKKDFYNNVIIPYKGQLESWFIENHSLINYFKIIFFTVLIVLKPSIHILEKGFRNLPSVPQEIAVLIKSTTI